MDNHTYYVRSNSAAYRVFYFLRAQLRDDVVYGFVIRATSLAGQQFLLAKRWMVGVLSPPVARTCETSQKDCTSWYAARMTHMYTSLLTFGEGSDMFPQLGPIIDPPVEI